MEVAITEALLKMRSLEFTGEWGGGHCTQKAQHREAQAEVCQDLTVSWGCAPRSFRGGGRRPERKDLCTLG